MGKAIGCILGILLIAGIVLGGWFFSTYNGLVGKDEGVKTAWSEVENNYQRRMDLIPNLVETVKGVADFEKETYTEVAAARAAAGQVKLDEGLLDNPEAFRQFEQTQGALSSALSRLLVTVERYPELKAQANFQDLQVQLEGTENRIATARRRFNETAQGYNTTIRQFPAKFVAMISGFRERPYFSATEGADRPPQVKF